MHMSTIEPAGNTSLETLPRGESAVILSIQAPTDFACRLRAMGLCEGASVSILHDQNPVIVKCDQTCMAICRSLLPHISVSREHPPLRDCPGLRLAADKS